MTICFRTLFLALVFNLLLSSLVAAQTNYPQEIQTPSESELQKKSNEILVEDTFDLAGIKLEEIEDLEGLPARTVRIDIKKVEGAELYDVEVIPSKKIWANPLKFRLNNESPSIRLRLSPGKYAVRTRSLASKNKPGQWSDFTNFWVQFRPIINAYPAPNDRIEPRGSKVEFIVFEWPRVENAKYYLFRLKDQEGKIIRMVITKQTFLRSEVQPEKNYSWIASPMTAREEYKSLLRSDKQAPYSKFSVLAASDDGRGTLIKISKNEDAIKYQFEIVGVNKSDEAGQPSIVESYDPSYRFRLPPGEYEMRARHFFQDGTVSEWSAPGKFFIQRFVPKLVGPTENEEVDSTNDEESSVVLRWAKDETASSYKVFIYNEKKELVFTERTTETFLKVKLPHDSAYTWGVRAFSAREPTTEPKPEMADGVFKINKYIPLELSVGEEPSQFYGWLRHISSIENFYGENYDNNSIVRQQLFGGEGEGALGYWWRKKSFGILGHASLAGFLYEGKIYNYVNYGIHLGYRHKYNNGDRLRAWIGTNYREIPEVLTHPFTQNVLYSKIKSLGPQLQATYSRPVDDQWAMMGAISLFYSAQDRGTPLNTEQIPDWSYRASFLASYKYSRDVRLVGGYTYKVESGAYYSADTPGAINKSRITGHYLSLIMEYALEEPMK